MPHDVTVGNVVEFCNMQVEHYRTRVAVKSQADTEIKVHFTVSFHTYTHFIHTYIHTVSDLIMSCGDAEARRRLDIIEKVVAKWENGDPVVLQDANVVDDDVFENDSENLGDEAADDDGRDHQTCFSILNTMCS